MKKLIITLTCLLVMFFTKAQSKETLDKIEAAKIGLITERLALTPEQAEKFWPIYQEFSQKQRSLRVEFKELKQSYDPNTSTEEENKRLIELGYQIKERQIDLEKNYSEKMQQVITSRQLLSLKKAESDFRQMLIQRIRKQRIDQNQSQRRWRNEDEINRRRNN